MHLVTCIEDKTRIMKGRSDIVFKAGLGINSPKKLIAFKCRIFKRFTTFKKFQLDFFIIIIYDFDSVN